MEGFSLYPRGFVGFYGEDVDGSADGFWSGLESHCFYGDSDCVEAVVDCVLKRKESKFNRVRSQRLVGSVRLLDANVIV